jgi:ribosomal protein L18E
MDDNTYTRLKGQLLILEQIKEPSPFILEAIQKLHAEIRTIEARDKSYEVIKQAEKELLELRGRYPSLDISYNIKKKEVTVPPAKIIQVNEPRLNFNVVTHLNAINKNYTFTDPRLIIFQNREYSGVKHWKDVLETVCNIMQQYHPVDINKILQLSGKKRVFFSRNINQLASEESRLRPRKIKNTDIYIEHNNSANRHVDICYQVVELFGHKRSELNFITY